MTITGALNNAMAGLRAAGRSSELIAENISNATTPGYGRRELVLSSTSANLVGGVSIVGVTRHGDPAILSARRSAQADQGLSQSVFDFLSRLESTLGTPDKEHALTNKLAVFETSLLEAASRPDAQERLDGAVLSARELVTAVNDTSKAISTMRSEADRNINAQVTRLNDALEEMVHLNTQIARFQINGQSTSALVDMRQNLVDEINTMVPVREVPRDHGKVALFSEGGVILVDGPAAEVEFTPVHMVTPHMSQTAGTLSGLTVNGNPVRTSSGNGGLAGGTLAAQFAIRDELGPDALTQIDAFARDLVERFQDNSVDPSLAPGDPGLFTDAGLSFSAANEVGLAERLNLNTAVDFTQGGESWRIRDGIGATTPGSVGQSAGIDRLRDALKTARIPATGDFGTGSLDASQIANSLMGRLSVQRMSAEQSLSFSNATFAEMSQAELAAGVDTDTELQNLMLVEKAYAANARIFEVVDEMLSTLLRI